jgi:hypothetical protein
MVDVEAWLQGVRSDPRIGPCTRHVATALARAWRSHVVAVAEPRALMCLRRYGWIASDRLEPRMSRSAPGEARAWSGGWRDCPRDRTRIRAVDLPG